MTTEAGYVLISSPAGDEVSKPQPSTRSAGAAQRLPARPGHDSRRPCPPLSSGAGSRLQHGPEGGPAGLPGGGPEQGNSQGGVCQRISGESGGDPLGGATQILPCLRGPAVPDPMALGAQWPSGLAGEEGGRQPESSASLLCCVYFHSSLSKIRLFMFSLLVLGVWRGIPSRHASFHRCVNTPINGPPGLPRCVWCHVCFQRVALIKARETEMNFPRDPFLLAFPWDFTGETLLEPPSHLLPRFLISKTEKG